MKKTIAAILAILLVFGLTGCGSDSVAIELEKFINNNMTEVNQKYKNLKAEMSRWDDIEESEELIDSIINMVLPNLNESIDLLSKITLQTEEVKEIKDKYNIVLEAYKEGYQIMLTALENDEEGEIEKAEEKINEGVKYLDDYNKSLEELAKVKKMEVIYKYYR